jgi:hypothetical protein
VTQETKAPVPQPTESEAIVAALRGSQNPEASQVPPVALLVDIAGNIKTKRVCRKQ